MSRYCLRLSCIVALWLMLVILPAFSLDPSKSIKQYGIEVWNANRGFPYFAIHSMLQTKDGYIWLATDDGAVRFDGVQFTLFDSSNVKAIRHNNISAFAQDNNGNLWIGTRGGGLTKLRDGIFTNYSIEQGLPGSVVHTMCKDREGNIWLGIEGFGLSKLQNNTFLPLPVRQPGRLGQMYLLYEMESGSLVFGAGKLTRTTPDKKAIIEPQFKTGFIKAMEEDYKGICWVGTDLGLSYYESDTLRPVTIPGAPTLKPITTIFEDSDKNIWIGTEGSGLYRYANGVFSSITMRDGLPSDRILSIIEDREENLWIGTRGGGLVRLKNQSITTITENDGLVNDYVLSLYECRDGTIFVGTKNFGMDEIRDGKVVRNYRFGSSEQSNYIRAIYEDVDGTLIIGTQQGIFKVNRSLAGTPRAVTPAKFPEYLTTVAVRLIFRDKKGILWLGSYGRGLWKLIGNSFVPFDLPDSIKLRGAYSRNFLETNDGTLWLGTQAGVYKVVDSTITHYNKAKGLAGEQVFALHYDNENALWVGTYGNGLSRIKNGSITSFSRKNGLLDDVIYSIIEDNKGNLWMSGNRGIFTVPKHQLDAVAEGKQQTVTCISYGIDDGMKSVECNGGSQFSGIKTRDGKLMFATVKGVVIIDPDKLQSNLYAPPVAIERVYVDGLPKSTYQEVRTNAGMKDFEFNYTALSFVIPEKVRFRYILEGYDQRWTDADTRRKAYYTNLPPGTYVFRVIACNNDGIWNFQGASLNISIPPQFWETWWFLILAIISGIASIVFVVKVREKKIKARAQEKIALQRQLADLESRALRAQMNPHFIFNALNSIQECILTNKTEAACEYLSKFAQLLRITLESSEKTYISLDKEIQVLQLYLELESLRFDNEFDYTLSVDPELENMTVQIPAMMIQPYVENAIWHGLLHKQGDRKLSISLQQDENLLLCIIEDNGIGRKRAAELRHALKKEYESKGMKVTRERLEMMRKGSGKNASVRIIDLADSNEQPSGTKIELLIPLYFQS